MDPTSAYNFIRSRFVNLKITRDLVKKHGLKIKYGWLSEDETATVKRTIEKFLTDRRLRMKDLVDHLVTAEEFPIHDLVFECTQACELRTFKSVHTHLMYFYHPYTKINWSEDDKIQLIDLVNQKGYAWKEISYHLSKFKDLCRLQYLRIIDETTKKLTKNRIEQLLLSMPATEEEWNVLCTELKLSKEKIKRDIEKFLNGKKLCIPHCHLNEIKLCLNILNQNHYCKLNLNIERIIDYLESDPLTFGIIPKIDGSNTPFVSSRGLVRKKINPTKKYEKVDREDSEFEELLDNLMEQKQNISSHTKFLMNFLTFFNISPEFNLEVEIRKDDIFWFNITRELVLIKSDCMTKYNLLSRRYEWKTFKDIYDTIFKLSYDYVMIKTKETLLESKKELIEVIDNDEHCKFEKGDIQEETFDDTHTENELTSNNKQTIENPLISNDHIVNSDECINMEVTINTIGFDVNEPISNNSIPLKNEKQENGQESQNIEKTSKFIKLKKTI